MGIKATTPSSQYLARTASLPAYEPITVCVWARIDTDTDWYSAIWSLGYDGSNYIALETAGDGESVGVFSGPAFVGMVTMTVGQWYFLAFTIEPGQNITGYWATPGGSLVKTTGAGTTGMTAPTKNHLFTDVYSGAEDFKGSIFSLKVWNAALSQKEIENEMYRVIPARTKDLHGWYPFLDSSLNLKDFSGLGLDWSLGSSSSPSTTDSPPVSWSGKRFHLTPRPLGKEGPGVDYSATGQGVVTVPKLQPVRKLFNRNISAIISKTLGTEGAELTRFLSDLQRIVEELYHRVLVAEEHRGKDGFPKHGAPVPILGGQIIHLKSIGKDKVLEVRHGLGRTPVGGFFLLQTSFNQVILEGDASASPAIPPATSDRVFVKMAGPAGERAILILV